jgi:predicted ester cyclase
MSTEDNKALVRRFYDGLNLNDVAIVDELCTPDFVLHDPAGPGGWHAGGINSREEYKQYLSGFFASLPGQFTIDDMIAEGDKVVARWTYRGTHQGQWRGVSPTGKEVTFTATTTSRFVDGKLAESWQNVDNLGVVRQLGLYPAQG